MNYTFQSIDDWEHNSALKITNFQESVKMSTYLVCFIVCDFKYLERTTKFGTKVTYTRCFTITNLAVYYDVWMVK